jgi:hypothetical protein
MTDKHETTETATALWQRLNPGREHKRIPFLCGDIPMRIAADGTWFYQGGPIGRIELVKLFASVLKRDTESSGQDGFWLQTPAEMAKIEVEDAPFLAVEATLKSSETGPEIEIRTNLDHTIVIGQDNPLAMRIPPSGGAPVPYIQVRPGLDAKATRSVYYHLAEMTEEGTPTEGDAPSIGVWSQGEFFVMGHEDEDED